jgi:hypothetical protein
MHSRYDVGANVEIFLNVTLASEGISKCPNT